MVLSISVSAVVGEIVHTPALCPGSLVAMLNSILLTALAFASWIAASSVHSPGTAVLQNPSPRLMSAPSAVELTVTGTGTTWAPAEVRKLAVIAITAIMPRVDRMRLRRRLYQRAVGDRSESLCALVPQVSVVARAGDLLIT